MGSDHPGRRVRSDEHLIDILYAIREHNLHGVTDIANQLDLAKSSVHTHLSTLEDHGFVTKKDGEYYIGLRFLDFGMHARHNQAIYQAAREKLSELAETTGEQAWCVTEERYWGVYLDGASGDRAIHTRERVGTYTTLHDISAGKAILAFLPEERVRAIIDHVGLIEKTDNTITDSDTLLKELETIREEGVAYNFEESMERLHAVGVPVRKVNGGVYGAISIGGPAERLSREDLKTELRRELLGVANEIEINIRHL